MGGLLMCYKGGYGCALRGVTDVLWVGAMDVQGRGDMNVLGGGGWWWMSKVVNDGKPIYLLKDNQYLIMLAAYSTVRITHITLN